MSDLDNFKGKLLTIYNHALLLQNIFIGDQKGLYIALKDNSLTAKELAEKTNCDERYIEEWLVNQTLNGIITRSGDDGIAGTGSYSLNESQSLCLASRGGVHDMLGGVECITGVCNQIDKVSDNFTTGNGIAWTNQNSHVHHGVRRFFAPIYEYLLTQKIIPAIGLEEKLKNGCKVADIGCGHGISTMKMASVYSNSQFYGFDYDNKSIEYANKTNKYSNAIFTSEHASNIANESKFDIISVFDCFHDMNDPEGAAKNFYNLISDDGCVFLIEPLAGETINANNNIIGQIYSGFSPTCCMQSAKYESKGSSLGTLAPSSKIEQIFKDAGFSKFEQVQIPEVTMNRVFVIKK